MQWQRRFFVRLFQIFTHTNANDGFIDDEQVAASNASDSVDGFTWTEEEEKAVRWKLDRVIVPVTTFLYLLCFLDRYVCSPHSTTVNPHRKDTIEPLS